MQAGPLRSIRMQVQCPLCSTRLVFEVAAQYAGRTVRVTCTGCDTPIDASTDMPTPTPHQGGLNPPAQDRTQLANGLANRMHKGPHMGASPSPSNEARQQQQQQRSQQGGGKGQETLKFEVQCPHPEVKTQRARMLSFSRDSF
jgi:hypothetical protein